MKKKSKKKKTTTTRRRKVGAASAMLNPASPLVMLGSAAIGFLMADKINAAIDKAAGTADPKLIGAGEVGVGAALVFMKLGKKKTLFEVIPGGIIAGAGAKRLLKEFGVLNGIGGYQAVPVIGQRMLNGYGKVPVLTGYTTQRQSLNGVFNGYNVPPTPKSSVMGSTSGSGYGSGSGYMDY